MLPPSSSTDAAANCAEPANVVADITIGASEPMPTVDARMPYAMPKLTEAGATGAIRLRPSRELLRNPVPGQVEPEGEAGVRPVATEAALDRGVLRPLRARDAEVLGARPGVEDQSGVTAEQHHDVRRRVGADAGECEQVGRQLVVGQLVDACLAEPLEIEVSGRDRTGQAPQVLASIPRSDRLQIGRASGRERA